MHRDDHKTVLKLFGDLNPGLRPETGLIWPKTRSQPDLWPEKAINLAEAKLFPFKKMINRQNAS